MASSMNLVQLQTFLWVTSLRSFRKTAEKMETTQPAISSRIAKLEKTLGVRLFERDSGFIRLTAKGLELLPYAEELLRTSIKLQEQIGKNKDYSGVLRFGTSETIIHTWLPQFISSLEKKFPNVRLEISVDTTTNLRKDLIDRSLDFAFLMGPVAELNIDNHELMDFPLIWVTSPSLMVPNEKKLSLDELTENPILTYAPSTRPYLELVRQLKLNNGKPARIFPSSSIAAILKMALDGIGVASLPKQMVENQLKDGTLQEVQCVWSIPDLNFTASFPTAPYNPLTERIVQHALEVSKEYQKHAK